MSVVPHAPSARRRSLSWRWVALALSIVSCAALNVYRTAFWKTHGVYALRDFARLPDAPGARPAYWARSYARIEVYEQRWRPVRLTLRLRAPAGAASASPDGTRVQISVDYVPLATVQLGPDWATCDLVVTAPAARDGTLALQLEMRSLPPAHAFGFGFDGLTAAPILRGPAVALNALVGAIGGALLWWALLPRRWPPPTPVPVPAVRRARAIAVAAGLFLYFGGWALIRPPFQTGDEPQHFMRTTSVLLQPWTGDPGRAPLDPRFINPLAVWEPRATAKLPFDATQHITVDELRAIKRTAWPVRQQMPPLPPLEKAIASYPALYYATLFAVAQPLTTVLGVSPYDSTYLYRLATCALAAGLWAAVFVALDQTSETAGLGAAVLLLLACTPMLAYLSSGITADSVSNPLSALAILAFWRLLARGTHRAATLGWLLAGALVKPAALQLIAALAVGGVAVWLADRHVHLKAALLTLARAAVLALGGFYLWSRPRFLGTGPSYDSLRDYLANRVAQTGTTWAEYWGLLGWLDYHLAWSWYHLLLALVLVNLACVWWRPRRPAVFVLFGAATVVAFIAATLAGEFFYLPQAGYTLQGRYFLPVGVLVAAVALWHDVRFAQGALIAGALVVTLLLVQRTVDRYYQEGWRGAREGLPFVSYRSAGDEAVS